MACGSWRSVQKPREHPAAAVVTRRADRSVWSLPTAVEFLKHSGFSQDEQHKVRQLILDAGGRELGESHLRQRSMQLRRDVG